MSSTITRQVAGNAKVEDPVEEEGVSTCLGGHPGHQDCLWPSGGPVNDSENVVETVRRRKWAHKVNVYMAEWLMRHGHLKNGKMVVFITLFSWHRLQVVTQAAMSRLITKQTERSPTSTVTHTPRCERPWRRSKTRCHAAGSTTGLGPPKEKLQRRVSPPEMM